MAPHVHRLSAYASQRLVSLFDMLSRKSANVVLVIVIGAVGLLIGWLIEISTKHETAARKYNCGDDLRKTFAKCSLQLSLPNGSSIFKSVPDELLKEAKAAAKAALEEMDAD